VCICSATALNTSCRAESPCVNFIIHILEIQDYQLLNCYQHLTVQRTALGEDLSLSGVLVENWSLNDELLNDFPTSILRPSFKLWGRKYFFRQKFLPRRPSAFHMFNFLTQNLQNHTVFPFTGFRLARRKITWVQYYDLRTQVNSDCLIWRYGNSPCRCKCPSSHDCNNLKYNCHHVN
jgi:hypothetical protein